jgi:hypothetical protein
MCCAQSRGLHSVKFGAGVKFIVCEGHEVWCEKGSSGRGQAGARCDTVCDTGYWIVCEHA